MSLPSGTITYQDRATADVSIAAVMSRLTSVARTIYEDQRFREHYKGGLNRIDNPDAMLIAAVSRSVYSSAGDIRSYIADVRSAIAAVERSGSQWLHRELAARQRDLEQVRVEMVSAIAELHAAARDYYQRRERLSQETELRYVPYAPVDSTGFVEVETPASQRERRLQALHQVNNRWLSVLAQHPARDVIFGRLAASEATGEAELEVVFVQAHDGLTEFGRSVHEHEEHVWRYAPIVVASLVELGALRGIPNAADRSLAHFMLDIGRLKSQDKWESLSTVAGIAIAGVSLLAGPGAAIFLAVANLALTSRSAWLEFERERENDLARTAQVFAQGEPFSDRPSNYGPLALDAAAALLSAFELGVLVRQSLARRSLGAAGDGLGAAMERNAQGRTGDAARESKSIAPVDTSERPRYSDRGLDRGPTREESIHPERDPMGSSAPSSARLPERVTLPDCLKSPKVRHLLLAAADIHPISTSVARGRLLISNKWWRGALYYARDTFYFISEQASDWAVRIGKSLDDWAFGGAHGVSLDMLGSGALDEALRAAYRQLRRKLGGLAWRQEQTRTTLARLFGEAKWQRNQSTVWLSKNDLLVGDHESLLHFKATFAQQPFGPNPAGAFEGWHSHHIIEWTDLKQLGLLGSREQLYNCLPCVLLPGPGHRRIISLLNRSKRPFSSVSQLREAYSAAYEALDYPGHLELVELVDVLLIELVR
ncbi:MAG: hypothetical protein FLDDKLPJ_01658 [Phycisphaerae bacterium]|nr:hypothetical protein [Phycisphaerae bacterium]